MRKIILWLGRVPASLRKLSTKVLIITTKVLEILDSKGALFITSIIPGEQDEAIRMALVAGLQAFRDRLEAAESRKERKRIAGELGAYMVAMADGRKERPDVYVKAFETVYEESKPYMAA